MLASEQMKESKLLTSRVDLAEEDLLDLVVQ